MASKIRVGAVSYLNTKPLLYGIEHSKLRKSITLQLMYPSQLARAISADKIDVALLPVAASFSLPGSRIISRYGIGADGPVASVCIFSHVPLQNVTQLLLDYQSRTSVALAQLLLREYWQVSPMLLPADEDYISRITGTTAGVIIGDRALMHLQDFPYIYDLSIAWKAHTGLPFIFAAWISNKELPEDFLAAFDEANAAGMKHLKEIAGVQHYPHYDLYKYYTENIHYRLTPDMHHGMETFRRKLSEIPPVVFGA